MLSYIILESIITSVEDFSSVAFLDYFANIEDPRIERHRLYPLNEIFLATLCAKICDEQSFEDIEDFGKAKINFLKGYLPYKNGIPSHGAQLKMKYKHM